MKTKIPLLFSYRKISTSVAQNKAKAVEIQVSTKYNICYYCSTTTADFYVQQSTTALIHWTNKEMP